jgi:hypothetical protein
MALADPTRSASLVKQDVASSDLVPDVKPYLLEMFQSPAIVRERLGNMSDTEVAIRQGNFEIALAAVASEIENNIQNDSQAGVINTRFSETMRFASSIFVVRALASMMQWWNQAAGPSIGYVMKKMVTGQFEEAGDYLKLMTKLLGSASVEFAGDVMRSEKDADSLWNKTTRFIKDTSPFVFYRAAEGHDVHRSAIRNQIRHGHNVGSKALGVLAKKYENWNELALSFTIGKPERLMARAIYLVELKSKMKKGFNQDISYDQLIGMSAQELPALAKQYARIMVTDMMGQSDQAKKSWLFQSRSRGPIESSFFRSIARFSTHTATTSANLSVMVPMLWQASGKDAKETRKAALENIVGTLTQNVLFNLMKFHTLVPLVLYGFAKAFGDDDEDAAYWAQAKANEFLDPEGKGFWTSAFLTALLGKNKPLINQRKKSKAAKVSTAAELTHKASLELVQGLPYFGALFGYSAIQGAFADPFLRESIERSYAKLTGLRPQTAWYERDTVGIRAYPSGPAEDFMNLTAPGSLIYDGLQAGAITGEGLLDDDVSAVRDILPYLMAELLPMAREWRNKELDDLRKKTKD